MVAHRAIGAAFPNFQEIDRHAARLREGYVHCNAILEGAAMAPDPFFPPAVHPLPALLPGRELGEEGLMRVRFGDEDEPHPQGLQLSNQRFVSIEIVTDETHG